MRTDTSIKWFWSLAKVQLQRST